jgi:peptide-methionine (S)-S-oxide reductase
MSESSSGEARAGIQGEGRTETATFAAGCFWGVEASLRRLEGVLDVRVGYTGGTVDDPDYRTVCSGRTGHAEAVNITFDPDQITYAQLLDAFWQLHDPTTLNRQGPDVGTQYRSAIFTHGEVQSIEAKASMEAAQERFKRPIVTQIEPAATFWDAEEYHQQYFAKQGIEGGCVVRL